MSSLIPILIARRIRQATEARNEDTLTLQSQQPEKPKVPKVPKSIMTICSFIFFIISTGLAVSALLTAFLPLALFAISIGIDSVILAVLSLRDL